MFLNLAVIEDSRKTSVSLHHYFQVFCDLSLEVITIAIDIGIHKDTARYPGSYLRASKSQEKVIDICISHKRKHKYNQNLK